MFDSGDASTRRSELTSSAMREPQVLRYAQQRSVVCKEQQAGSVRREHVIRRRSEAAKRKEKEAAMPCPS